jgi:hypothetical protein
VTECSNGREVGVKSLFDEQMVLSDKGKLVGSGRMLRIGHTFIRGALNHGGFYYYFILREK